jgi:hypothetical protein
VLGLGLSPLGQALLEALKTPLGLGGIDAPTQALLPYTLQDLPRILHEGAHVRPHHPFEPLCAYVRAREPIGALVVAPLAARA